MANGSIFNMGEEQIRELLFRTLRDAPEETRRKELIERCIDTLGFPESQLRDVSPTSPVIRAKGRIGMVLSACMKEGYIRESESGRLTLMGRGSHVISREKARDYLISLLEGGAELNRAAICRKAEEDFAARLGPEPWGREDLRKTLVKELGRLTEEGHVLKRNYRYRLTVDRSYPNTEMGSCLRAAAHGGDLKKCFLEAVHLRGGEWFESYCVELMELYYHAEGKKVLSAAVTGGSDDGGIDGVVVTEDALGYRETLLMQMKNRRAVMNPKDLREFYGAVCAEKGTRGIFITVSTFHPEAWRFINRVDNLTGLDGGKLFELACVCGKGILLTEGEFHLDEAMFLSP